MQNTLNADSALEVFSVGESKRTSGPESVRLGGRKNTVMEELFKRVPFGVPRIGELVEGAVLAKDGARVFVDIGAYGCAIIYGREYLEAREITKVLKPGSKVMVKILELENEEGYAEVSLREAGRDLIWIEAEERMGKKEPMELEVREANRGGLVLEWKKIKGFLPASQLKLAHYPRVEGGDKEKIFEALKKLEGQKLLVTIIALDPEKEKVIFSEKGAESEELRTIAAKYEVGQIIEGEVTGVVDFGIFIKLEEGLEGLAHLSELDWSLVENPHELFKVGESVAAKIIAIDSGRVSLSVKALKPDPWVGALEKYQKGDIVKGKVLRFNKYGVLVSIEEGVSGLCHISEFGSEKLMREKIELGGEYPFQITLFEPRERRMTLSYLDEGGQSREHSFAKQ